MPCARRSDRALTPILMALVLLAAGPASAWDEERALVLAERLDVEIAATVSAAHGASGQDSVREERQRSAAFSEVPALEGAVADLLRALRSGGDRDATLPYYERVQKAMGAVVASIDDATPRKAAADRWQKSNATLRELGRLYGEE